MDDFDAFLDKQQRRLKEGFERAVKRVHDRKAQLRQDDPYEMIGIGRIAGTSMNSAHGRRKLSLSQIEGDRGDRY